MILSFVFCFVSYYDEVITQETVILYFIFFFLFAIYLLLRNNIAWRHALQNQFFSFFFFLFSQINLSVFLIFIIIWPPQVMVSSWWRWILVVFSLKFEQLLNRAPDRCFIFKHVTVNHSVGQYFSRRKTKKPASWTSLVKRDGRSHVKWIIVYIPYS